MGPGYELAPPGPARPMPGARRPRPTIMRAPRSDAAGICVIGNWIATSLALNSCVVAMANRPSLSDFREKVLKEGVLKHRQSSIALPRVSPCWRLYIYCLSVSHRVCMHSALWAVPRVLSGLRTVIPLTTQGVDSQICCACVQVTLAFQSRLYGAI